MKNRWISVTERLPQQDLSKGNHYYQVSCPVLVLAGDNYMAVAELVSNLSDGFASKKWEDEECRELDVTYWMPLPQLPNIYKKKTGKGD